MLAPISIVSIANTYNTTTMSKASIPRSTINPRITCYDGKS